MTSSVSPLAPDAAGPFDSLSTGLPSPDGPEARSLLLCLRGRWQPAALEAACEMMRRPGFEWRRWYEMACAERLAPLVYHTLHGKAIIPEPLETELRMSYLHNSFRNDLRVRELRGVLGCWAQKGIPTILLKGAALALAVYGNVALRPMGDLDLLVPPEHVGSAQKALQQLGYWAPTTEMDGNAALSYGNEAVMHASGPAGSTIEVHWGLLDSAHHRRALGMEWFWRSAEPVNVSGVHALVLGPEAQMLHLCAHLVLHHAGEGMLWLHDLAEVVYHYRDRLDWETVVEQAQASDLVLPLQRTLPRLADGWNVPIPAGVLARLAELKPSAEEERLVHWMTIPGRTVEVEVWSNLFSLSGWGERARYLAAKLFPAPEYMRQRYSVGHPALLPLYYPYRWWLGLRSVVARVTEVVRSRRGEVVP